MKNQFIVMMCVVGSFVTHAGRGVAADRTIRKGQRVFFAAEAGTDTDILGKGFEENLSPTDATGMERRVYPSNYKTVKVNEYDAKVESVENSFDLEAHGRYLFAKAGTHVSKSRRYVVVRVYQASKMVKLKRSGMPKASAPMYASSIYYGWALYLVIEGSCPAGI